MTDRSELERVLKTWPSRNLEQLLDDLSHLGRRWRSGEPVRLPRVTVTLRSGTQFVGEVLDLHQDRSGTRTVLVHLTGRGPHLPSELDVAHLPWSAIDAVTVHDVGSLARPPDALIRSVSSKEELLRRAANVTEAVAQKVGTPIPIVFDGLSEENLEPLGWLLGLLEDVALELAERPDFADAMRGRVKGVHLGVGRHAHLVFSDGVLTLSTPMAWNDRASPQSLKSELEALL